MKKNFICLLLINAVFTTNLLIADDTTLPTQNDPETINKIKDGTSQFFSEIGQSASELADTVKEKASKAKENWNEQQKEQIEKCKGTWKFALADESYKVNIADNGKMEVIFHREDNKTLSWSGTYEIDLLSIHFSIKELKTSHFLSSQTQPLDETWTIWYSFKNLPENQIKITCTNFPKNNYSVDAAKNTIYVK